MDSYVFKTKSGEIGYFQKDGDACELFIELDFFPIHDKLNWNKWVRYKKEGSGNVTNCTHADPISKAISFFLWEHCEHVSPDVIELHKNELDPGTYYPRINRDFSNLHKYLMRESTFIDEVRAYYNIVESMENIFKVVEPTVSNKKTFGHRIREVLTVACTEVEYLLLQALKENGYQASKIYKTTDYVKLLPIYQLNEYEVELKMYPELGVIKPFSNWNSNSPTKSLFWYDAYNSSKHDRGGNFHKASVEAMVNAIAAIHIILEAQYGAVIFDKPMRSSYESCFYTSVRANWNINKVLTPLLDDSRNVVWKNKAQYFS